MRAAIAIAPDVAVVDLNLSDGFTGPYVADELSLSCDTRVIYFTANPDLLPSEIYDRHRVIVNRSSRTNSSTPSSRWNIEPSVTPEIREPSSSSTPPGGSARVATANAPGTGGLLGLAVAVVVVAGLYFAKDVLIPVTLAVLLSFILSPMSVRFAACGFPDPRLS